MRTCTHRLFARTQLQVQIRERRGPGIAPYTLEFRTEKTLNPSGQTHGQNVSAEMPVTVAPGVERLARKAL